jgi:hypothetical protein
MSKYKKIKSDLRWNGEGFCTAKQEWCVFMDEECDRMIDKKTDKTLFDICRSEKVIFKKVSE